MPDHSFPASDSVPPASQIGLGPGRNHTKAADTLVANQAIETFVSHALNFLPVQSESDSTDNDKIPLIDLETYHQEDDLKWTTHWTFIQTKVIQNC